MSNPISIERLADQARCVSEQINQLINTDKWMQLLTLPEQKLVFSLLSHSEPQAIALLAKSLNLSAKTIEYERKNILKKIESCIQATQATQAAQAAQPHKPVKEIKPLSNEATLILNLLNREIMKTGLPEPFLIWPKIKSNKSYPNVFLALEALFHQQKAIIENELLRSLAKISLMHQPTQGLETLIHHLETFFDQEPHRLCVFKMIYISELISARLFDELRAFFNHFETRLSQVLRTGFTQLKAQRLAALYMSVLVGKIQEAGLDDCVDVIQAGNEILRVGF